jgi:putative sterol carrier protein
MSTLEKTFEQMKSKFDASTTVGINEIFQFDLIDAENFYLEIKNKQIKLTLGMHDAPSVALSMPAETLQEIIEGSTDGMQAFMAGQITPLGGNIMLATKLSTFFPS